MRIGFVSDTHDHKEAIYAAFEDMERERIRNVVHLGDLISPFNFKFIREVYTGNLFVVFGNNDGERLFLSEMAKEHKISLLKLPQKLEISGVRILVMHEPFMVEELAESQKFNVVAYGHTHKIHLEKVGKTLIVNPGEACGYLTGKKTFVIYESDSAVYEVREIKSERN
ncbi:MAG: metallophosphoesterase [Candidatus Hydrothermia bacterium]